MNSEKERIAVIHRKHLPGWILKDKLVLLAKEIDIHKILQINKIEFLERMAAECMYEYKQIIPYTIIQNNKNEILIYQRNGSEKRLNQMWSVGWGGHVLSDDFVKSSSIEDNIIRSAYRELNEEIKNFRSEPLKFLGIINEEFTEVGKTHIGLVFFTITDLKNIFLSSEAKNSKFISLNEISNFNMEMWSEMAIELLNKM